MLNYRAKLSPYRPGSFRAAWESTTGQAIERVVDSPEGKLAMAVATHLRQPAILGIEELIFEVVGDAGFTHTMKRMGGHRVRQAVEDMGGELEKLSASVSIPGSRYTRASRYAERVPAATSNPPKGKSPARSVSERAGAPG